MALISAFYVGEVVTSLFKQASGKASGKADVLMYSTINGAIGCLSPVDDLEKLKTLVAMESLIIGRGVRRQNCGRFQEFVRSQPRRRGKSE